MCLHDAAALFGALGSENRLRILKMLQVRSLCVCEITEVLGLSAPTVSRHLSLLREAGLITDRRDGRFVTYELEVSGGPLAAGAADLLRSWGAEDPTVQRDAERAGSVDREFLCST